VNKYLTYHNNCGWPEDLEQQTPRAHRVIPSTDSVSAVKDDCSPKLFMEKRTMIVLFEIVTWQ
jgi:hypothetical protein